MNEAIEKRSVSGPSELFEAADQRMRDRMIGNFSEYVRALIRDDLEGRLKASPASERREDPQAKAA